VAGLKREAKITDRCNQSACNKYNRTVFRFIQAQAQMMDDLD
jgi:hypothetical protein